MRALRGADEAATSACARRFLAVETISVPGFEDLPEICNKPQTMLARLRKAVPDPANQDSTRRMKLALWAAQYGDDELALSALRRRDMDFEGGRISAIWHPALARVRKTQAFKDMLGQLKLADYWRATGKWGDFAHPQGADDFECC
jgi:hypothetical protein